MGPSPFQLGRAPRALARLPASSVWVEMTPLAGLAGALNLGQGFPDWAPPRFLMAAAAATCADGPAVHQYARSKGEPALAHAVADVYAPRLRPRATHPALDPLANVIVTAGASHALSVAIAALAGPGDEVVLIEPAFDVYTGAVLVSGATPVYVPLRCASPPDGRPLTSAQLKLDMDELAAALSDKTRLLVLNSPHNPTGKVFSRAELDAIYEAIARYPHIAVLSDEVYEYLVFNPDLPHIPFASLSDDAFERTVSIYSAGKTFAATGWKIGWAIAPEPIISRMFALHQYSVFSVASTLQRAVASALLSAREKFEGYPTYYAWLTAEYKRKRDNFVDIINDTPGLTALVPDGAFYVMARHTATGAPVADDAADVPPQIDHYIADGKLKVDPATRTRPDYNFCRRLAVDRKVVAIPPSAFFCDEHKTLDLATNFVRFAFCKQDHVLDDARRRLCCKSPAQ